MTVLQNIFAISKQMADKNFQMSTGVAAVVQKVVEACQDESKRLDLIEVAKNYPPNQLRNMQRTFQAITGTFLDAFLKKHLSKDFETLVLMLYKPRAQLLCELIRGATKGAGTDEKCLVDVLLTIEAHEVREIRQLYHQLYNDSLGDVVRKDCGNKYMWAKLVNAVATGDRIPRETHELEEDLVLVRKAIETKGVKKDEVSTWIRIFATYTRADFRQLHRMYAARYNGESLRAGVEDEFQGLDEYAFKLAHDFLYDPCCAAAFSMNVAFAGSGNDSDRLNRISAMHFRECKGCKYYYKKVYGQAFDERCTAELKGVYGEAIKLLWEPVTVPLLSMEDCQGGEHRPMTLEL